MDIVCDSCSAQLRLPDERVGDRGAKLKCPSCGVVLVIFPQEHVAMAEEAEPTTEDWSSPPEDGGVPAAIKRLFAGDLVHPPGTEPPVMRESVPRPPEHQLSVTPPPPRAARAPLTPTATVIRASRPAITASDVPPRRFASSARTDPPPPRREPAIPPPALLDVPAPSEAPTARRERAPRPSETATQPPASSRGASSTASGAQNRTGPTGGPPPRRDAQAEQGPPMTYAPPWGAWSNATPAGPPYYGPPPHAWTPGAPPPWQPYHTGSSAPPMAYPVPTGTPAPMYSAPWTGTPAPVQGNGGPPMMTTWQPAWVPAIVLGMERTTLVMLLTVVLVVGFAGSCLGVGSARLFNDNRPVLIAPTVVPGSAFRDPDRRPRPVAPKPVPADRVPPLQPEPQPILVLPVPPSEL
ncbi:MAG: zinc-ribbon domain-containing protein [Alphaproteobacteria bacterium]|nr:zinc-ribbon domain-containing protein [Alphaproteobacteria bacterium]